ncbi:hypothetical protein G7Y89_g8282 [Cudoniella acicularis]|uniref:Uncharacterized protein n=1 Tax=Cudoniella acicularis TaxID=354080 RepID=A0A8H4W174_9HELO|nr:hypothetical protein G7Y89_g8282 [Cudoniella acicularis]
MSFFYDSSSDHEDGGLPIILEPDHEPTADHMNRPIREDNMAPIPRDDGIRELQVPTHPIPSMQGAFAESMLEVAGGHNSIPRNTIGNAAARRKHLLDQDIDEETHAARWRKKSGQQYHQFWKLMAQISFGIYLLLNGIAKDEEQVMNILQSHVDEVDEFLETTLEDFDLAQEDIEGRLKFLKLPLENIHIFDAMLEDRNFRYQIVNGNERIEHIITRTAAAMNDALKDVQQGLDACKEFTIYLAEEQEDALWKEERPDMQKVFDAMKGNVEGWYKAYVSLQTKGNHLAAALVQLGSIVAEMDRRAGEFSTSARSTTQSPPPMSEKRDSRQSSGRQSRQSRQFRLSISKELPTNPAPITPAIRAALPAFQMVQDRERTPEPEPEQDPESSDSEQEAEPEPDFILKPHTYSPAPSPRPPPAAPTPVIAPAAPQSPPPEIRQRSSLRKRFSLKRKEPSETALKPPPTPTDDGYWGPRQLVRPVKRDPPPRERESTLNTPPSRGLDSAYCSDFERPSPPNAPPRPALISTPISTNFPQSPRIPTRDPARNSPPVFTRDFVPSPRSDQQFFRPVNASPHSPLQRPWTAAPSNIMHIHSNSSSSNLRYGHTHTPSQLGNRNGAPSAMGMSMMSDKTTVTQGGTKLKKKRSAFGWLKKAFSLSEEEKAAFQERRRATDDDYRQAYQEQSQQRWLDGKRIR